MKQWLKRSLPVGWQRRFRRLGRLRWATKYRLLSAYGFSIRSQPLTAARFVLADPEVESHSYELGNAAELTQFLSRFLNASPATVARHMEEARADPVLLRDRGWRLNIKRFTPLGRRTAWFIICRIIRPKLVVETGIHDGLGSEAILRALELNAQEGCEGQLISFDIFNDTGWAVAERLKRRWRRVIGSTFDVLESTLAGQKIDFFIRDTPPSDRNVRFELGVAMRHQADAFYVVDSAGEGAIVLREICRPGVGQTEVFTDLPKGHVMSRNPHAYARFGKAIEGSADLAASFGDSQGS